MLTQEVEGARFAEHVDLGHTLALFRYGIAGPSGVRALHNIWGLHSATAMAALSLLVLVAYATVIFAGAIRLFAKAGDELNPLRP